MLHRSTIRYAKRLALVFGVLVMAALGIDLGVVRSAKQAAVAIIPNADYRVVHGWPALPENSIFEEVSAVAVDSRGNVLVLQRGGRKWPDSDVLDQTLIPFPTVFVFDGGTGSPLARWAKPRALRRPAPNETLDRSARSEFLKILLVPFARPVS